RILAIGNPLCAKGRFYTAFTRARGWKRITISALSHPNVRRRSLCRIPGCVTREFVESKIEDWCEPINPTHSGLGEGCTLAEGRGPNAASDPSDPSDPSNSQLSTLNSQLPSHPAPQHIGQTYPDVLEWNGRKYRPGNIFRARILGEFPTSDDDSLISLRWV